jgi:hypothetical protein
VFIAVCWYTSTISKHYLKILTALDAELNPGQEQHAQHSSGQNPATILKYYLKIPIAPDAGLNPGYGPNVYLTG